MHTHFGSATFGFAAFISVLLFGTIWRLVAAHGVNARSPLLAGLSRAALVQF